jgi:hypothetical protein
MLHRNSPGNGWFGPATMHSATVSSFDKDIGGDASEDART